MDGRVPRAFATEGRRDVRPRHVRERFRTTRLSVLLVNAESGCVPCAMHRQTRGARTRTTSQIGMVWRREQVGVDFRSPTQQSTLRISTARATSAFERWPSSSEDRHSLRRDLPAGPSFVLRSVWKGTRRTVPAGSFALGLQARTRPRNRMGNATNGTFATKPETKADARTVASSASHASPRTVAPPVPLRDRPSLMDVRPSTRKLACRRNLHGRSCEAHQSEAHRRRWPLPHLVPPIRPLLRRCPQRILGSGPGNLVGDRRRSGGNLDRHSWTFSTTLVACTRGFQSKGIDLGVETEAIRWMETHCPLVHRVERVEDRSR